MKIIVLYNLVTTKQNGTPTDLLADQDTVKTAQAIEENLIQAGYDASLFEVREDNVKELKKLKPDIFFNNAFGIGSVDKSESDLATILERSKVPFTGSDARAILLTTDKTATKKLLEAMNIPTPKYFVVNNDDLPTNLKYPLFVKPANEDCSLGINENAFVRNEKELKKQIEFLRETYAEAILIEEYIEGRELNVSVLGNGVAARVLPISEITFGPSYKNKPKIVDFAAKWEEQTDSYKETNGVCPAELPKRVEDYVKEVALKSFLATGCHDIARVDIRLSSDNVPYVLEVNANPGIGPNDGASRSARAEGLSYPQFLEKIVQNALSR